ncbi:MAG TPA: rhamnogalacturonan acetylesterase [Opitutales bacterium]|nr:rhamnogalacturonan acetylesterase [Opitutales bacterium]
MKNLPIRHRLCPYILGLGLLSCATPFSAAQDAQSAPASAIPAADKVDLKFSFGPQAIPGYTQVKPEDNYTIARGYGFDLSSTVEVVDRGGSDPTKAGYVTGANGKPFFFSAKLAPGEYNVKVTLGDTKGESTTTVKSETRRLMLEAVHTASGQLETRNFYTHIRVPQIPGAAPGQDIVRMKPRENKLYWIALFWKPDQPMTFMELDWDEKLTLEFSDAHPAVCTVEITHAEKPITVYLVGDSTMTDQMMEPWGAWGMQFPRWFKPPVVIANYAESGESAASFFNELRWPKLLSEVHPGDYILIQFGINDRTLSADMVHQYFTRFITEARAKGAIPVLVTSQNLRAGFWGADGKGQETLGGYPYAMWETAVAQKTPYIGLNEMSTTLYETIGQDNLPKAFVDSTHQNAYGSYELAKCVVQACINAKLPFAQYVVDDWKTFDPKHPDAMADFKLPPDPQLDTAPGKTPLQYTIPLPIAGKPGEMADPPPPAAPAPARGGARGTGAATPRPAATSATN